MASGFKYILSHKLAKGGMAEIFLTKAIGPSGSFLCAAKKILPHLSHDPDYIEMFRTEAALCSKLKHPNISEVYGFEKIQGSHAIIMEFIAGSDLRALLAVCEKTGLRPNIPMVLYIISEAAKGLHYAHTRLDRSSGQPLTIVHRDISPQNILIGFDGSVKVIDFGIADFEAKSQETKHGIIKGKYSYMSPEQISAKSVDPRSDIFSLGIVMWECLAMKRLFVAETDVLTIKNVQNCHIPYSISHLNPGIDADLEKIIDAALNKDKKKRFTNADRFSKAIKIYLKHRYPKFRPQELADFMQSILDDKKKDLDEKVKRLHEQNDHIAASNIVASQYTSTLPEHLPVAQAVHSQYASKQPQTLPQSMPSTASHQHSQLGSVQPSQLQSLRQYSDIKSQKNTLRMSSIHRKRQAFFNKNQRQLISLLGVFLVLLLLVGFIFKLKQKPVMYLELSTIPRSVQIEIDGVQVENHEYLKTPLRLPVTAGKRFLKIQRDGYFPIQTSIEGTEGSLLKVNPIRLNPNPQFNASLLSINNKTRQDIYVDIDKGFYLGKLPIANLKIAADTAHHIMIYPEYPHKNIKIPCEFVANSKTKNIDIIKTAQSFSCRLGR